MAAAQPNELETRVLLLTPTRRDAEITRVLLERAGLSCVVCPDPGALRSQVAVGAGAILTTEETLASKELGGLLATLERQPSWSDLPVVLLVHGGGQSPAATRAIQALRNVTLLEKPAPTRSVVSAVQAAVRSRLRQYQIRDQIEAVSQAQAHSRQLQEELTLAIDASELGTFHADVPLGRMDWNDHGKAQHGFPPAAEVDFELFCSRLHPDDREPTRKAVTACVLDGEPYDLLYRTLSPAGEMRWVHAIGRTFPGVNGEPHRFDGTTQDVTGRERIAQALRQSERRFRFLGELDAATAEQTDPERVMATVARRLGEHLRVSRCAYADVEPDAETFTIQHDYTAVGTTSTVGRYALSLFGPRTAADQRGGRTLVVHDVAAELSPGEGREMFQAIGVRAIVCCPLLRGGRLVAMMAVHQTEPRRWGQEEVALVEAVVERSWAYIERARADRARSQSEAQFRQLADAIPQLAWMARADGFIFWYNQRWHDYCGTTPEQMQGWGWQSVHDPAELPRIIERWKAALASGESWEDTFPLRRHDGEFRWHLSRAKPFRDASGQVVLWFGTNTDVTDERRRAEERERLLEAERAARAETERTGRMKDEFLATLSHELRTPLNAILGWSTILRSSDLGEGGVSADDVTEGLAIIERNARAQNQIIEDLLDMSRIISGKVRLDVQRIDLAPVVEAALETVRPAALAKGIRLQAILDPRARPVSGDPNRLQQIFWNLLGNAIKFTPKDGRVQVVLERVNSHLEVNVTDTGQGISAEFLPYVCERFRQADGSTARAHGGLGLGLAIAKQLVELHGGTLRVESAGLSQGAKFTVALPLTVLQPDAAGPAGERRHPGPAGVSVPAPPPVVGLSLAGVRVLVVDDEPDARALVQRLLEDRGAAVRTAASSAEAVAQISAERPDVLVSDIGMPEEDGYGLIRRVRALPAERGGAVPAVALTAYARPEDRMRAVLAGFQMHVAKPVEPAELLTMVASLAGRTGSKSP